MKKPYKPTAPSLPSKPLEMLSITNHIELGYSNTIGSILKQVPPEISHEDIFILVEDEDDYCCECDRYHHNGGRRIKCGYYTKIKNPNYDAQMKEHELRLDRFSKLKDEYKLKVEKYEKEKKKYDEWLASVLDSRNEKELLLLRKKVKQLEKKAKK